MICNRSSLRSIGRKENFGPLIPSPSSPEYRGRREQELGLGNLACHAHNANRWRFVPGAKGARIKWAGLNYEADTWPKMLTPLAPVIRGEGSGVRGNLQSIEFEKHLPQGRIRPPHPRPSPPEYRGRRERELGLDNCACHAHHANRWRGSGADCVREAFAARKNSSPSSPALLPRGTGGEGSRNRV